MDLYLVIRCDTPHLPIFVARCEDSPRRRKSRANSPWRDDGDRHLPGYQWGHPNSLCFESPRLMDLSLSNLARSPNRADPMQVTLWHGGGGTPAAAGKGQEGHHSWATIARAVALDRNFAATAPLARVSRPTAAAALSSAWPQLWGLVQYEGRIHVVLFASPTPTSSVYEVNEVLWARPQEEARRPGASLWAGAVPLAHLPGNCQRNCNRQRRCDCRVASRRWSWRQYCEEPKLWN